MDTSLPNVTSYLSLRDYLEDFYRFRKMKIPGFTYEKWSSELGYSSRSFLKMVVSQKRKVNRDFLDRFVNFYELDPIQTKYLSLLAGHAQAESDEEKSLYIDKILEIRAKSKKTVSIEDENSFLSHPMIPTLQTLLSFQDLDRRPPSLALLMGMKAEDLTKFLSILQNLGLARNQSDTDIWDPVEKSFYVPKNSNSASLRNYHDASLQEAMRAQDLPAELRRFRSLLMPFSESEFLEFLEDLQTFVAKAVVKYDRDQLSQRRLYKINFNLYPLTEKYSGHRAFETAAPERGVLTSESKN